MAGRSLGAPETHGVVKLAGREHQDHQLSSELCVDVCLLLDDSWPGQPRDEGQVGGLKSSRSGERDGCLRTRAGDAHRA